MASTASLHIPRNIPNFSEISMQQSLLFSESLKDLKNLRSQLYSAAEYFELSYTNDDQKHTVVNTLKDYAIKALVNTVDHLGSVSYKVNDLLDVKFDEVSGTELRVASIEQRLRTCREYIDHEGLSEQSLIINAPKYHKRYILPVGVTIHSGNHTKSIYQGCSSLDDEDDWHHFKNGANLNFSIHVVSCVLESCTSNFDHFLSSECFHQAVEATIRETPTSAVRKGHSLSPSLRLGTFSFTGTTPKKELDKRTISPLRFPLLRSGSLSSRPTTPNSRRPTTPNSRRPTTPNSSRPSTPNASVARRYPSEPLRSSSMRLRAKEHPKDIEQYPTKSRRFLKALLSGPKSKKDDILYKYLDEY